MMESEREMMESHTGVVEHGEVFRLWCIDLLFRSVG